jgi:DNA-binding transcriptional MerR regulator
MMTIHELAKISNVSVRTLHYYDKIDLLKPCCTQANGYRKYNKDSILQLQQIMFYKEMDLPLKQIKTIMNQPGFDHKNAIQDQKDLLTAKRNRLNKLIEQMEQILKGENPMDFSVFEHNELEEAFKSRIALMDDYYRQSLINTYGSIEAFLEIMRNDEYKIKQSAEKYYGSLENYIESLKQAPFPKEGMSKLQLELDTILKEITTYKDSKVSDPKLQDLVEDWKKAFSNLIQMVDTEYTQELFRGIYEGYMNNTDVIKAMDKIYGEGSAVFIGKAMEYNANNN